MAQQSQATSDCDIISSWAQRCLKGNGDTTKSDDIKVLTADQLSIVWGSDNRYWHKISETDPNSDKAVAAYELGEVCWLQIDGKYKCNELSQSRVAKYGVYFIVKLKNNLNMNGEVSLKLTRPDRPVAVRGRRWYTLPQMSLEKVDLEKQDKYPRNEWVAIKVGEFTPNKRIGDKNVKFSLNGHDGTTWKTGLVIIGAAIVPLTA